MKMRKKSESRSDAKTLNQVAAVALHYLCREIRKRRQRGWTAENRPVKTLVHRHDRILARWPNAYAS